MFQIFSINYIIMVFAIVSCFFLAGIGRGFCTNNYHHLDVQAYCGVAYGSVASSILWCGVQYIWFCGFSSLYIFVVCHTNEIFDSMRAFLTIQIFWSSTQIYAFILLELLFLNRSSHCYACKCGYFTLMQMRLIHFYGTNQWIHSHIWHVLHIHIDTNLNII